jgi:hypothetical protein
MEERTVVDDGVSETALGIALSTAMVAHACSSRAFVLVQEWKWKEC